MKLLFLISSLSGGGAERVTTNLANHWAANGWDVAIVTIRSTEFDFYMLHPRVQRIVLDMASVSGGLWRGAVNNVKRVVGVRRVLHRFRPDAAVSMMTSSNIVLALASIGMPRLASIGAERIHPPQEPNPFVWDKLRSLTYRMLTSVVALTQESADWLSEHTLARHLVVIPNSATWPLADSPPTVRVPEKEPGGKLLLAVGRLTKQKGFDLLLRAFARIAPAVPEWRLIIVGEGSDRRQLEEEAETLGLSDRVFLPGRVGNVGEWYQAADLYVMSSRYEGFPNTLAEAMAYGLPTVSFDCDTGPRDLIRHAVDGFLVTPGSTDLLADALHTLMTNHELRDAFAKRAPDVLDRFSFSRIAGLWETAIKDACVQVSIHDGEVEPNGNNPDKKQRPRR